MSDYLWDRSGTPDPEVVRLERLLSAFKQADPPRPLPLAAGTRARTRSFSFVMALMAEAAMVAALVGTTWFGRFQSSGPSLEVTRLSGAPRVGSRSFEESAQLHVGGWLRTDANSRASIDIGGIGRVEVDPDTRLGLLSTRPGDYRMHLARGTLHALIWAPPGQFAVETQSSTAVDLGCSYSLTMDDEGVGKVTVTTGWVGFEWRGRESFIPAGAVCLTRRGLGPGTPHHEDTSDAFRLALDTIDLRRGSPQGLAAALDRVLAEARERDAVTLWHLLTRVDGEQRNAVFDRLSQFVPPPAGVTRDGIRAGNRAMLDQWWDQMGFGAVNWWRVWKQQWRDPAGR